MPPLDCLSLVRHERLPAVTLDCIPKQLIQTYHKPGAVPEKVFKNLQRYAIGFHRVFYADADIRRFLEAYFDERVTSTFEQLHGAHKADLFRYCFLYVYGGIYADIKTEFLKPLSELFSVPGVTMYTVQGIGRRNIYQGVLASVPRDPLFLEAIAFMIQIPKPVRRYHAFIADMHDKLTARYGPLETGRTLADDHGNRLYLFKEQCSRERDKCHDGLDRYKLCCFIQDHTEDVIKSRYADFPW